MKQRTLITGMLIISAIILLAGCSSIMKQVGNIAGSFLTGTTNDLNEAAVSVFFMRNVYPKATNDIASEYFEETWRDGANMVYVSLLNRDGVGMLKVDGQVIIDGEVVPHIKNGYYGKWLDANDVSPKKVVIKTSTGQEVSFTVTPPPPIKIKSINGKKENAVVDITQPLDLELKAENQRPGEEISIALLSSVMGIHSFLEYGTFKYADKMHLPAAMWQNAITPYAPISGSNWLRVERFNVTPANVKGVGATQIIGQALDCVPVTVQGELDETWVGTVDGQTINIRETLEKDDGFMQVEFNKPNAYFGRPVSSGRKFAMASFTVRATKLQQQRTSSHSSTIGNVTTTTTTTTTRTFPTLPDDYWENLVNKLYADFERVLKNNYDIELIPVEDVLRAPSYKELAPIKDKVSVVEVEKSYKGTKNLIPTTFTEILNDISTTFAWDRKDARLIRELGVDGLIAVTIDLEMPWESFSLTPRMSIRISGPPNGYKAGPTIYLQGLVHGSGMPLEQAKMNADYLMDVLPNVIREKELMKALETGIHKIKTEEKNRAYEAIWALK
ncbi:MAG TPA: hypothetical protein ENK44_07280 [Caldithrix abyssi]|uniref:Uncharacterized protein n=1 Tax=Caldithrix abyssi TaxID=187145 RepID=A0A7V4U0Q5_CALAY|nr:hypothetical protein [Caldithrix abyssi]